MIKPQRKILSNYAGKLFSQIMQATVSFPKMLAYLVLCAPVIFPPKPKGFKISCVTKLLLNIYLKVHESTFRSCYFARVLSRETWVLSIFHKAKIFGWKFRKVSGNFPCHVERPFSTWAISLVVKNYT